MKKISFRVITIISALVISIAILGCSAMTFFGLGGVGFIGKNLSNTGDYNLVDTVETNDAALISPYKAFATGSRYVFTDKNKVNDFRAGTIDNDLTEVIVDRTKDHGTLENPYVISDKDDWTQFATAINSDSSRGAGKIFVLSSDIDFEGTLMPSINLFSGTLYGLGHTIFNPILPSANFGTSASPMMYGGLFLNVSGDVNFVDLSVKGYTTKGGGVFVGSCDASAKISFLNCHSEGVFDNAASPTQAYHGGLVGNAICSSAYFFRCSTKMRGNVISPTANAGVGGMVGWLGTASTVYDCYSDLDVKVQSKGEEPWSGVLSGIHCGQTLVVDNLIGRCHISCPTPPRWSFGALCTMYVSRTLTANWDLNNIYITGEVVTNSGIFEQYLASDSLNWGSNVRGTKTANNVHYCSDPTATMKITNKTTKTIDVVPAQSGLVRESNDPTALFDKAKADDAFSDKIWNKEKIGTQEALTESPVKNFDATEQNKTIIQYRNLKIVDGEEVLNKIADIEDIEYTWGDSITHKAPSTSGANHNFVGWTRDKETGVLETDNTTQAYLYGNITFYAVWDLPDVTATIAAEDNKTTIEYGTGHLTLSADVSSKHIENPKISYQWLNDGTAVKDWTTKVVMPEKVLESGVYTVDYIIRDSVEPLWMHKGTTTNSVDITIEPGEIYLNSFEVLDEGKAYVGRTISEVKFVATAKNSNSTSVSGTFTWELDFGLVKDKDNNRRIRFVPDDKENYNEEYFLDVDLDAFVKYLQITFKFPKLSDRSFSVDLPMYNQNYSANAVRKLFNDAYQQFLQDNPAVAEAAEGLTPKLDDVFIDEYDTPLQDVIEDVYFEVTLEPKNYTVTIDPKNGEAVTTNSYQYGKRVLNPGKPTNSGLLFLGWYWMKPTGEGENTAETRWEFETDVITQTTTIYAKWLDKYTLDNIVIVQINKKIEAFDSIKNGDLKVTAILSGEDGDGKKFTQEVVLLWDEYKDDIVYNNPEEMLYVGNSKITITYSVGTDTVSESIDIVVQPKKIDTSELLFEDKEVEYDGSLKTLTVVGDLPNGIVSVRYEYRKNGKPLDTEGAIDRGEYIVVAIFTADDVNYKADNMTAKLTIKSSPTKVTAKWDSDVLTYKAGEKQHPTVHIFDSEGREITNDIASLLKFEWTVGDGVSAGSHTVKVSVSRGNYAVDGEETCSYTIAKQKLASPTIKDEMIYNGAIQSIEGNLDGYIASIMNLGGTFTETNAGKFRATITLTDTANYMWAQNGNPTIQIEWTIKRLGLVVDWDSFEFVYTDGVVFGPKVIALNGVLEVDQSQVDLTKDILYTGDFEVGKVGAYVVKAKLNSDSNWTKNYVLEGNMEWSFVVVPKEGMEIITIEWDNNEFIYNGNVQRPNYTVLDKDGNSIDVDLIITGDYETSKWAGKYQVNVEVEDKDTYFIRSGAMFKYSIKEGENGAGGITDPQHPDNPNNKPDDGGDNKPDDGDNNGDDKDDDKDNGFVLPENFPLWQVIAGAVALLAGIGFFIRTGMNASKTKAFKKKTEKTKKMYSFAIAPIVMLGAAYLGLEQNIWTIIACCLIGLCVIGFIAMLGSGHARKKAEAGYESAVEEKNLAIERKKEEEQRAKEEEQRRRDEEMKMMFMSMMSKNGPGNANDGNMYATNAIPIEEIVSKTVAALMPTMQTLMLTDHSSADNDAVTRLLEQQEKLITQLMERPAVAATKAVDDDEEDEDEEEMSWDEESDEEEIDEITPVEMVSPNGEITMTEAIVKKTIKLPANFRARLKISSDKNREAYVALKNYLCSKKGITFRVSGRVEKIKYKGELICVIGVATKHLKLWFALDVDAFDKRRYFQKDVSDKPRYAQVPMLVKVGSERALTRAIELIDVLCEKFDIASKRRYTDKNLQVLAYTLKHNALLKAKMTDLLCDSIHVHDVDVISDEDAQMSVEHRIVAQLEEEKFATLKLDDIDKAFVDGQKVTLEALKKKGLVADEFNGYKVAAGTRLTKPLIIIANEFTTAAAKMIVLTGGRAILLLQALQD